ncbi:MAG: QueT transporter family protein [bacterium]|nr:QueT transporter family protein [bacterium]MCM1375308.1 QueT transporter family protein [Muribaculum sp.]MCM1409775.1 QueT transporter family protein [Lachnospiraceae bacterium]
MKISKTLFIAQAAIIAALYVVLTLLANALGLANYAVQLRFSEALTILPFFTPAAIPGLFLGCLISNLLTGAIIWDVIFGSLATLLGAVGTWLLCRRQWPSQHSWIAPLPPIVANTLIVPFVLYYAYHIPGSVPFFMLTVGIGEILSCGVLGMLLLLTLQKYKKYIFPVKGE